MEAVFESTNCYTRNNTKTNKLEHYSMLISYEENYYGNAMKYPIIFKAKKTRLKDSDLVYPGQVLHIPALEE